MALLSKTAIDNRFTSVKQEVDRCWMEESFDPYVRNRSNDSIIQEYETLDALRKAYRASFPKPEALLKSKQYCDKECLTFAHSLTDETYNSTCITIGKRRFLALEGPTEQTMPTFLELVDRWRVAYLVSLIDENDPTSSYPYWMGRVINNEITLKNGNIPFHLRTDWKDRHATEPQKLLKSVDAVRSTINSDEIIAVHCTGGVGRTGTLVTTLCLLDEIEQGKTPSIGSMVLYLNLFRPQIVSNVSQYLSLYKTLDHYLENES